MYNKILSKCPSACKTIPTRILAAILFLCSAGAGEPSSRHVLLLTLDGVRPDALKQLVEAGEAPHIANLIAEGSVTWNAVAGGWTDDPDDPTNQRTDSGPGWTSILTGVWRNKHGVSGNSFEGRNFAEYPHFFRRLKETDSSIHTASFVNWAQIHTFILNDSGGEEIADVIFTATVSGKDARDEQITEAAEDLIANGNPGVIFFCLDAPDGAGHSYGFSPDVPEYMQAVRDADTRVGRLVTAVKNRATYANENWLYVVTTDHGGLGTGHGGQSPEKRTIFFIVSGGDAPQGKVSNEPVGMVALPQVVMRHLRLPIQEAWGWEGDAFVLDPLLRSAAGARSVFLQWTVPAGGFPGLTGFEILREGQSVTTVGPDVRRWADQTPGDPSQPTVSYEIRPLGTSEPALRITSAMPGYVPPPPPPRVPLSLEVYLPLNGDLDGAEDTGIDGTAIGANAANPVFVPGRLGQAARFSNTSRSAPPNDWAISLGNLDELYEDDFSLSLWLRYTGTEPHPDSAVIGNSDWTSGQNTGWLVASTAPNSRGVFREGKIKTDAGGRRDQRIDWKDGEWHHVVLVVDKRENRAFWYLDAVPLNPGGTDIGRGTLGAGFDTLIGASGPGSYGTRTTDVDDVALFAGRLPHETIQHLYNRGLGRPASEWNAELPDPEVSLRIYLPLNGDVLGAPETDVDGQAIGGNAGEPSWIEGKFGQAARFSNTSRSAPPNDWAISLGNLDELYEDDFSLSLWLRYTGAEPHPDSAVIGNSDWASGQNTRWLIATTAPNSSGVFREGKIKTDTGSRMNQRIDWKDGEWRHLVLVVDRGENRAFWYLDSVPLNPGGTEFGSGSLGAGFDTLIGASGPGSYGARTTDVDDVAFFSGLLSPLMIQHLFNHGEGRPADHIITPSPPVSPALMNFQNWMDEQLFLHGEIDPEDQSPHVSATGDGVSNLLKYALNVSPQAELPPGAGLDIRFAEGGPLIRFPQRNQGSGVHGENPAYVADGLSYRVFTKTDLNGTWESAAGYLTQLDSLSEPHNAGSHLVVLSVDTDEPLRFFKLAVELEP